MTREMFFMKLLTVRNVLCFLFTLLLPAAGFAFTSPGGARREATKLLNRMRVDAYQVKSRAATLQSFDDEADQIGWQGYASALNRQKHEINRMDYMLPKLRSLEPMLPAYQQAEIRDLAPALVEVTDTTQSAMNFLSHHQDELWQPRYQAKFNNMYFEASRLEGAIPASGQYDVAAG